MSNPNTPELEAHRLSFDNVLLEIETHFKNLSQTEFNWRASPGQWSVGQCLEHLNLSNEFFLNAIDRLMLKTKATGLAAKQPYRRTFWGDWFLKNSEPPVKLKIKTPANMVSPPDLNQLAVLEKFAQVQARLMKATRDAENLDLGAASERVGGPVFMTLGQWLALAAAHERRHIWQAHRVKAASKNS